MLLPVGFSQVPVVSSCERNRRQNRSDLGKSDFTWDWMVALLEGGASGEGLQLLEARARSHSWTEFPVVCAVCPAIENRACPEEELCK